MARQQATPAWARWDSAQSTVCGQVRRVASEKSYHYEGTVDTPHGIVRVYSQGEDGTYARASHYTIILGGRAYTLSEHTARSARGLATRAGQFAREIAAEGEEG